MKCVDSYVSLDLETTGLNPKTDKIIEIGALKVLNGEPQETFSAFVNPACKLSEKVIELTGIQDKDLVSEPPIEVLLPEILNFIGDLPLLGHRILFDYSFLKKAFVNQGMLFEKTGIDTLCIARKLLPDLESKNLGFLCNHFLIEHQAHRALGDALATSALYVKLQEIIRGKDEVQSELYEKICMPSPLIYQTKKEGPASKRQKQRLIELLEKHHIQVRYEVERLTKNEASRYTDKILSEYGK